MEKLHVRQSLRLPINKSDPDIQKVWNVVFEAQTESIRNMRENRTAASIDIAARDVITRAGYGDAFTHRVGHGIGIKGALILAFFLLLIPFLLRLISSLIHSP